MKRFKAVLKKIFCLQPLTTVLIAVPSFVFDFIMLGTGNTDSAASYIAYGLSAYALVITVTGFGGIVRAIRQGIENMTLVKKLRDHPVFGRYFSDVGFRSEVSLYTGLFMNLLYAAVKLFSGIVYHSVWFISLAVYYILLSVMRFLLLHNIRREAIGQNVMSEYRSYRMCGVVLLFMNQALIGIVVYIVFQDQGFYYPGVLIYVMAVYAFFNIISAIINAVKYRKHSSPIVSAAKIIKLTAALVSMLSFETAMLSRFGGDAPVFRRIVTATSGGFVCAVVLATAIYMIAHSTAQMKKH